ncbi:hypothetical protein H8959_006713 [Pygathrix nigripes]
MLTEEIWEPSTWAPYRYPKGKCMHFVREDEHCVWKPLKGTHVSSAADSSEEKPRTVEVVVCVRPGAGGSATGINQTFQLPGLDLPAASHVLVCWGFVLIRSEFTVYHELEGETGKVWKQDPEARKVAFPSSPALWGEGLGRPCRRAEGPGTGVS